MTFRKIVKALFITLFTAIIISSCTSDRGDDPEPVEQNFMKAKVNGVEKNFLYVYGIGGNKQVFSVTFDEFDPKTNSYYPNMTLEINYRQNDIKDFLIIPRTYTESADNVDFKYSKTQNSNDIYKSSNFVADDFTVTLTRFEKRVVGTFSGILQNASGDQIVITDGSFNSFLY